MCCFQAVRTGNSMAHAVHLLFCCIEIPRGLGSGTSQKSWCPVIEFSPCPGMPLTALQAFGQESRKMGFITTCLQLQTLMSRLEAPASGGFRIQSEIYLM